MHTRIVSAIGAAQLLCMAVSAQHVPAQRQSVSDLVARMTDSEIVAYVDMRMKEGLRVDEYDRMGTLILSRSSLVLPVMEKRIEEVLKSPAPLGLFTDRTVDPDKFVVVATAMICSAGNEYAMAELSKLVALDERRLEPLVRNLLYAAINHANPFEVAYQGLELGNPALNKGILDWIALESNPPGRPRAGKFAEWWAQALVERYGGVPTETQWIKDPIASQLDSQLVNSLHDEVFRLAAAAHKTGTRK